MIRHNKQNKTKLILEYIFKAYKNQFLENLNNSNKILQLDTKLSNNGPTFIQRHVYESS